MNITVIHHFRITDNTLDMISSYPGLPLFYSTDNQANWIEWTHPIPAHPGDTIYVLTKYVHLILTFLHIIHI